MLSNHLLFVREAVDLMEEELQSQPWLTRYPGIPPVYVCADCALGTAS